MPLTCHMSSAAVGETLLSGLTKLALLRGCRSVLSGLPTCQSAAFSQAVTCHSTGSSTSTKSISCFCIVTAHMHEKGPWQLLVIVRLPCHIYVKHLTFDLQCMSRNPQPSISKLMPAPSVLKYQHCEPSCLISAAGLIRCAASVMLIMGVFAIGHLSCCTLMYQMHS